MERLKKPLVKLFKEAVRCLFIGLPIIPARIITSAFMDKYGSDREKVYYVIATLVYVLLLIGVRKIIGNVKTEKRHDIIVAEYDDINLTTEPVKEKGLLSVAIEGSLKSLSVFISYVLITVYVVAPFFISVILFMGFCYLSCINISNMALATLVPIIASLAATYVVFIIRHIIGAVVLVVIKKVDAEKAWEETSGVFGLELNLF